MNLFSFFARLFNKGNLESSVTDIVTARNMLILPKRDELKLEEIEKLDEYKLEYSRRLKDKVLFSSDLDIDKINEQVSMNIELLENLMAKEDINAFSSINGEEANVRLVNKMVRISKMELYLFYLKSLIKETELRIIALEEILKEKNFLSTIRKRAISNKIENLSFAVQNFRIQLIAINADIESSLVDFSLEEDDKKLSDCGEEIDNKMKTLYTLLESIDYKDIKEIDNLGFSSIFLKLAYMERELEIFVYYNKDKVMDVERRIKDFRLYCSNEEIRNKFLNIKNKLRVFEEYGKDLVHEELLNKLYALKFYLISRELFRSYNLDIITSQDMNYAEVECYEKLIMDRIQLILEGKNWEFNLRFEKDFKNAIRLFSKVLKNSDNQFDFFDILTSDKIFLLLSFDYGKSIGMLFDNFKFKKSQFSDILNFYEESFKWNEELSFDAVNTVIQSQNMIDKFPLIEFYSYYKEMPIHDSHYYKLPEGLASINVGKNEDNPILSYIRHKALEKIVVTPSTLKEIHGPWLRDVSINSLYVESGVQVLGDNSLPNRGFETLILSPTLERLSTRQEICSVDTLIIDHYDETQILESNSQLMKDIIRVFFDEKSGIGYHYSKNLLGSKIEFGPLVKEGIIFRPWNDEERDIVILSGSLKFKYCFDYQKEKYYFTSVLHEDVPFNGPFYNDMRSLILNEIKEMVKIEEDKGFRLRLDI